MKQEEVLAKVESRIRRWAAEDPEIQVRGIQLGSLMIRVTQENKDCDIDFSFGYNGKRVEDHIGFWLEVSPKIMITSPGCSPTDLDKFERYIALYNKALSIARKLESWKEDARDLICTHAEHKEKTDFSYIQQVVMKDSKSLRVGSYRVSKNSKVKDIPPGEYTVILGIKSFTAIVADDAITFTRVL